MNSVYLLFKSRISKLKGARPSTNVQICAYNREAPANIYPFFFLYLLLNTLSTLFFMSFFLLLSLSFFEQNLKLYERVITNEKMVHTTNEEIMVIVYILSKNKSRMMFDCNMGCFLR